ncbi:MAG: hypothetical protein K1X54_01650 [Flavobacteriales bacterium]|nr:hypothetical protein [Flavobacteriales bacterium]
MKKFVVRVFAALCMFPVGAIAQDTTFHEIGLNATPFVNQYLNLGAGTNFVASPYMLTYEYRFGCMGGRFGIGATATKNTTNPVNDKPTEPALHSTSNTMNLRLGVVLYKDLSKRWSLKYGVDGVFSQSATKNWTVVSDLFGQEITSTTSNKNWRAGGAPFIFAQWHITDHFSLGTEVMAVVTVGNDVTKVTNTAFPEFDTSQKSSSVNFTIDPPTALFFIFRF